MSEDDKIFEQIVSSEAANTNTNLQAMDDFNAAVELFTGLKMQFVNAGWHPNHAELMVIEVMRSTNKEVTVKNEISFGGKKKDE